MSVAFLAVLVISILYGLHYLSFHFDEELGIMEIRFISSNRKY